MKTEVLPGHLVMVKRALSGNVDSVTLTATPPAADNLTRATRFCAGNFLLYEVALAVGVSIERSPSRISPVIDVLVITSGGRVGWAPGEVLEMVTF